MMVVCEPDVSRSIALPQARALGVDVGGSSTWLALAEGGRVQRTWRLPGGNLLLDPESVRAMLSGACRNLRPAGVAVGIAGLASAPPASREVVTRELRRWTGDRVIVLSDTAIAHAGAFGTAPGIAVCAGTGSVAVGGAPPKLGTIGGHGFLLDDRGSAYDLGRVALQRALRRRDLGQPSMLAAAVERASRQTLGALVRSVHATPSDREPLARLAPVVAGLAANDHDARAAVDEVVDALVDLTEAAQVRWPELPIAHVGGLFDDQAIRERFSTRTGSSSPLAPPHIGALAMLAR
jgi:N-acetylglucosamine kinase-like BadF-type ATPase